MAKLAVWLVRVAVGLLPARLRGDYGTGILGTFEDGYSERRSRGGVRPAVWFTARTVFDLLLTAFRERRRGRGRGHHAMGGGLATDVRGAVRALRRSPGFTVAAVLVLALGIGVNATIFTAVKATLLTPLPWPGEDRLVLVDLVERTERYPEGRAFAWSLPKFELLRSGGFDAVDRLAAIGSRTATLVSGQNAARVRLEFVTPDYLPLLGARPFVGRFTAAGDEAGAASVAVLGYDLWMSRFGGDRGVIGRTVEIESVPVEVIGVVDRGFDGVTGGVDAWVPLTAAGQLFDRAMLDADVHWFQAIGTLRPGVPLEEAGQRLDIAARRIDEVYPSLDPTVERGGAVRLLRDLRRNAAARTAVLVLSGAAALVLLIACANLAGLLLARGVSRRHEMAIRSALGGGRWRIARGLLAESLALATLGGMAGLAIAKFGVLILRAAWPDRFLTSSSASIRAMDVTSLSIDPAVLLFAVLITVATGVAFGILPALQLSADRPGDALRGGGHRVTTGSTRRGPDGRTVLIAIEVALALVLVVGAGLMTSSLVGLLRVDRGFDSSNLLTFTYGIPRTSAAAADPTRLHEQFLDRLVADGRITSAAAACSVPMRGRCVISPVVSLDGEPPFALDSQPRVGVEFVTDAWFETLRVPVLAGRTFGAGDVASSPLVAVINRRAASALFPDGDPVGRTLTLGYGPRGEQGSYTVIGVVGDVLFDRPEQGTMADIFTSLHQDPSNTVSVLVRTNVAPIEVLPAITDQLRAIEPGAALHSVATAAQIAARTTADTRVVLWLLAVFAAFAVLLAATGVWSVVAHTVGQRRRELGIRMALGAPAHDVVSLMLRQGAVAAGIGLLAGIPAAFGATRLLSALLFGVSPADPWIYGLAASGLTAITLTASLIPALQASRIDPVREMRAG